MLNINSNASWKKVILAIDLITNIPDSTGTCSSSEMILHEVTSILQDMYVKKRFEVSDDDWPPFQPEVYTTVALIHHIEKMITKKAVISIATQMHKGEIISPNNVLSVEEGIVAEQESSYLASCKYTNNIYEIFPPSSGDARSPPYTILIEGAPGIGKTVLSKEIAFLWASKTLLKHKKVLVLIYLRDPSVQKLTSFTELARYITCACQGSQMVKAFSDYLIDTSGRDLLFVFDGYDELPEILRQESFIADIVNRKSLPSCDIVITSRPAASAHLHKIADHKIEIFGFTDEDRKKYIYQAFQNNPTKIGEMLAYLQSNPFIDSLCYIPLNMTILMCLFAETTQSELPKTQTEINNQFICMTISRYFRKKENVPLSINSLFDIPVKYKNILKELSKLAFDLLGKDKIVFSNADVSSKSSLLSKNINGMGLLKAVKYFSFVDNCEEVSFNFLHFSLQEFLAAFHIASSSTSEKEKTIRGNFWNSRYLNTWIMYCGLTGGNSLALKHFLSGNRFLLFSRFFSTKGVSKNTIDDKIKCLHLFQCFLEAGNNTMCEQVGNFLHERKLDLSGQVLLPKDMHTLGFFLTRSSNKQWEVLNLSECYVEDRGFKIFVASYLSHLNTSSVKVLDISRNHITPSSLPDICKLVLYLKVQKLIVMNNNLANKIISKELLSCAIINHTYNLQIPLTVVNSAGDTSSITSHYSVNHESFEETMYFINSKSNKHLIELNDIQAFNNIHTLYIWNCKINVNDVKMLLKSNPRLKVSIFNNILDSSEFVEWNLPYQPQTVLQDQVDSSLTNNVSYALKSENILLIFRAHLYFNKFILNTSHKFMTVLQITNCFLTHAMLGEVGVIISSSEQCWEVVDLSYCRIIDDRRLTTLCNHISNATVAIKLMNLSNNLILSTSFLSGIIKLLQLCIVDEYVISYNHVSDDVLRDALLSEACTQPNAIRNFTNKHPLVVVNSTDEQEDDNFCSIYIINCRIDYNILDYPLRNNLTVGSLVLVNNVSLDGFFTTVIPFLLKVKVSTVNIVEVDLDDETALEIATKLKEIIAVHQTIENMQFILLSQTHLLSYGTSGKQIKDVVLHSSSRNFCMLQMNNCYNLLDNGVLDDVLTRCSPDLYSIDVTGCSIGGNHLNVLLTYLSNKERLFHLKRFDLSGNDLTTSFIESLTEILCHCIVEELVVAYNDNHKLNNAIVSNISPQSKILNFISNVPLILTFDIPLDQQKSMGYIACAYVYIVNCTLTADIVNKFNKLSQKETFVRSLVLCNYQMSLNASVHSFVLAKKKFLMIETADSINNFSECNAGYAPVLVDSTLSVHHSNYILACNKLFIFRFIHQQLTEVLTEHEEVDSVEFVSCNMLYSELKQVGNIISCTNKHWTSVNLSGCNIGDHGCNALCPKRDMPCNVSVTQLNLSYNYITTSSLNDIHQIILCWKVE